MPRRRRWLPRLTGILDGSSSISYECAHERDVFTRREVDLAASAASRQEQLRLFPADVGSRSRARNGANQDYRGFALRIARQRHIRRAWPGAVMADALAGG